MMQWKLYVDWKKPDKEKKPEAEETARNYSENNMRLNSFMSMKPAQLIRFAKS